MNRIVLISILIGLTTAVAGAQDSVRVLTYNIHHAEGTDGKLDLGTVVASPFGTGFHLDAIDANWIWTPFDELTVDDLIIKD